MAGCLPSAHKVPGFALVAGTPQINNISRCRIVPNMVIATLSDDNTHPSVVHQVGEGRSGGEAERVNIRKLTTAGCLFSLFVSNLFTFEMADDSWAPW